LERVLNFDAAIRKFSVAATVISILFLTGLMFAVDTIKGQVLGGGMAGGTLDGVADLI
jgi:hypothetical protein